MELDNASHLMFTVGPFRMALPLEQIQEVYEFASVSRLPGSASLLEGVSNYRGVLIPVFNLIHWLEPPRELIPVTSRKAIVHRLKEPYALRVDSVVDLEFFPETTTRSAQPSELPPEWVVGVGRSQGGIGHQQGDYTILDPESIYQAAWKAQEELISDA